MIYVKKGEVFFWDSSQFFLLVSLIKYFAVCSDSSSSSCSSSSSSSSSSSNIHVRAELAPGGRAGADRFFRI